MVTFRKTVFLKYSGKVSVFNIAGQLVYEDKVEGNTTKIDFFSFSSGIYIVKVGEKSMKLIKP